MLEALARQTDLGVDPARVPVPRAEQLHRIGGEGGGALEAAMRDGARSAINAIFARAEGPPAIGHALYPQGDPRAESLLGAMKPPAPIAEAIAEAEEALGDRANIDMALAALTLQLGLPREAPFILFAAGRMAGWLAHAMEQGASGRIIRPRATYVGS